MLAINAILAREWKRARDEWSSALEEAAAEDCRVPTFIVLDEAHNLIPKETRSRAEEALRDQFRTIVSEGRKYGLFVILVSQRPDKLDPLVLSECENKGIMRLNSEAILDITKSLMGLNEVPAAVLKKCLQFQLACVLLVGRWAPSGPETILSAARRTIEGGRNLREEHWTRPTRKNEL
jgi:DNA helicase HerA-like ATPase